MGVRKRLDPLVADRLLGGLDDLREGLEVAAHVRVLLAHVDLQPCPRLGRNDLLGGRAQQRDVPREQVVVEVAHDGADDRLAGGGGDLVDVDEAPPPLGRLGGEVRGQGGEQASGEPRGVDELARREAGVDLDAVDRHDHLGAGERLVLQLAHGRAVQRVGATRPETLDVEARGALADLLVRRETDAQGRAGQLGVRGQVGHRGHDLGDAGLVVGAQQRVAARGDDVMALLARQLGHRGRVEHRVVARQLDPAALVGAVDDRLDAGAGRVRARVDMGDEADHRRVAVDGAGERGHHVAVVVELGVLDADGRELLDEHARQVELARGARGAPVAVAARLGVDAHVALEAVQEVGGELLGQ